MRLIEAGKTLGDLDFGKPDAESDKRLAEYFVRTPQAQAALKLKRSHFLGRKGAGKSALFGQLPRLFTEAEKLKTRVILLSPDQYAWAALKSYKEQGQMADQAYTNAWKFTMAIEAAAYLAQEPANNLSDEAQASAKRLNAFLATNFGGKEKLFSSAALRLLKGLQSFNLEAFGFGVGFEKKERNRELSLEITEILFKEIVVLANEIGVVLAFDRLDDSWDGSEESKSLLVGLLKATKELNDKYSNADSGKGISVLVFLRADIYDGLQFDDKDKHRAQEEVISWSYELLEAMINERLPKGITIAEIFELGEMRGSIAPFRYLVKRTFLRPREVIQFIQECVRRAGDEKVEITKDNVRAAEERYSVWKVDDVKQEFRRLYPDIDSIIEGLRQGFTRYDSLEEFIEFLTPRISEVIGRLGSRFVVQLLFDASVVGVRLGTAGTARFKCEDSDLTLPAAGAVYVHQGLYKGLNIRERRTGTAADPEAALD